jgi:hypothetical protein
VVSAENIFCHKTLAAVIFRAAIGNWTFFQMLCSYFIHKGYLPFYDIFGPSRPETAYNFKRSYLVGGNYVRATKRKPWKLQLKIPNSTL